MIRISGNRLLSKPPYHTTKNSATLYSVQSTNKVKHERRPFHRQTAAGIILVLIACAALVGAFVMHMAGKPMGWSVLVVVGGLSALGLAGLSFIADLAETRADRQHHMEGR